MTTVPQVMMQGSALINVHGLYEYFTELSRYTVMCEKIINWVNDVWKLRVNSQPQADFFTKKMLIMFKLFHSSEAFF